ncbi:hypothetical protein O181_080275 [Austropuccinia psidii MF-1]|uniref:Uncharacterized protein n=1 Tax=Austropuccinia psidii MF-1 TaxID=1389203 RepID=A0A9Q3FMW9_9BASI|nr:hypothetical protein [Austropuccinia psidii MF-1]
MATHPSHFCVTLAINEPYHHSQRLLAMELVELRLSALIIEDILPSSAGNRSSSYSAISEQNNPKLLKMTSKMKTIQTSLSSRNSKPTNKAPYLMRSLRPIYLIIRRPLKHNFDIYKHYRLFHPLGYEWVSQFGHLMISYLVLRSVWPDTPLKITVSADCVWRSLKFGLLQATGCGSIGILIDDRRIPWIPIARFVLFEFLNPEIMRANASRPTSSCAHSLKILCARAARDHQRLLQNYQEWLSRRENRKRSLISKIDRIQSSSDEVKARSTNTLAKLQAEVDKMTNEDNETADRELLDKFPYALPIQKPAYKRLALQIAIEQSEANLKKATEERDAVCGQPTCQTASTKAPQVEEPRFEEVPDELPAVQELNEGSSRGPAAPLPNPKNSSKPTFGLGIRADGLLGKWNTSGGMTRKVSLNRPNAPEELVTAGWKAHWVTNTTDDCKKLTGTRYTMIYINKTH